MQVILFVVKTEQSPLRRNKRHSVPNPREETKETERSLPAENVQDNSETRFPQRVNTPSSVVKTR